MALMATPRQLGRAGCISTQQLVSRCRSSVAAAAPAAPAPAAPVEVTAAAANTRPPGWEEAKPFSDVPGPRPLPLLGNLWRFLPGVGDLHNVKTRELAEHFQSAYGPLCALRGIPGRPDTLFMYQPEDIETVFRNEGTWPVREGPDSLLHYMTSRRTVVPNSLAVEQGREWQEFRTAVNQVMMQPRNVKQYIQPIALVADEFIERMRKNRDTNNQLPNNFADELSLWALESITYVALDTRLGALRENQSPDSESQRVISVVKTVFQAIYELDFQPPIWKFISTPMYRKFISAMDEFTEIASRHVNKAVERLRALPQAELTDRKFSVLERLILGNSPQRGVSMALDMIFAGVDTTASVMSVILYQLATNPEKQRLLQAELDRVLPDPEQPLTSDALEQLKYLRACVKESHRIEPIIQGNFRTTAKDLVLAGYQVPKGTRIIMNQLVLTRDKQLVPRADEFLPERWLPGGESLRPTSPFVFLPFGFGPRMCVGKRFADLETEVLLASLLRRYSMEWHHPPAENEMLALLRYKTPLKFTMVERAQSK